MAQYAVNLSDSGGTSLQKEISLTGKALAGLEKQTQGLASAISGLFSSFSLDRVMTQAEKTVKRTTTTVRKQTQKALLSFDEIERIGTENTSTTSTTSVTTTTEDTTNVSALAAAFTTLQAAIHGALGAVSSDAVVGELNAIRTAVQGILTLYQTEVQNDIPTWLQGLALGTSVTGDLIGSAGVVVDHWNKIGPFLGKIPGVFSGLGSGILTALKSGIPGAIAGVGLFIVGLYDAIVNGLDWLSGVLIPAGATLAGASIGMMIGAIGGPLGALIGLAVGLVTDLVVLIVQNWDAICAFFSDAAAWFYTAVIQPVGDFFVNLWTGISQWAVVAWESIKTTFAPVIDWFAALFGSVWQTISDIFYNIGVIASGCWEIIKAVWTVVAAWVDQTIIQPVSGFFSGLWASISGWAADAWENIKAVFIGIGTWINRNVIQPVSGFFSGLWNSFSEWASDAWEDVKDVFSQVGVWFKDVLNGIIQAINEAIGWIFSGINNIIIDIKGVEVMGFTPFAKMKTIRPPQIPYLAQGAVLPANRPFLAVVGDQKHGTNVEAPLDVIKQALAEVLGNQERSRGNDVINIRFTGELAQLARILQPEITRESNRAGRSLMKGVVF